VLAARKLIFNEMPTNTAPLGKKTLGDAVRRAPDPRHPRYRATGAGERWGHGGGTATLRRARFWAFSRLEVGFVNVAFSRPTPPDRACRDHQRVPFAGCFANANRWAHLEMLRIL
jgi:hypothetical protein